jgi:hypothetical protein
LGVAIVPTCRLAAWTGPMSVTLVPFVSFTALAKLT